MFTYGINKKAKYPFRLIICGIYPELQACLERISGYENWSCGKYTQGCEELLELRDATDERGDGSTLLNSGDFQHHNRYDSITESTIVQRNEKQVNSGGSISFPFPFFSNFNCSYVD